MARFRNKVTGSIVNVSDEQAKQLGSEYEPAEKKAAPARKPASSPKSSDE